MTRFMTMLSALIVMAGLAQADPSFWRHEWPNTNFNRTSVTNWTEIMSGGPPKDGIPALSNPDFHKVGSERRI